MGYNKERTSHLAQTSIVKEKEYVEFFLNCERGSKNMHNGVHLRERFVSYIQSIEDPSILPTTVYGIDSSHLEQPLDQKTGSTVCFMSELMLVSTVSEVDISMAKFLTLEKTYKAHGSFSPSSLTQVAVSETFNFWFNGANLTPKNIANEERRNPKNGFKVSVRDALKKPAAVLANPNTKGFVNTHTVSKEVGGYNKENYRLIDALYDVFKWQHNTVYNGENMWDKHITHFSIQPYIPLTNASPLYNFLQIKSCCNTLRCDETVAFLQTPLNFRLGQYDDTERFCPTCGDAFCELDAIGLTDQYQSEMSNLKLLSDFTYFLEHLRCVQRLLCLPQPDKKAPPSEPLHNIAVVMDGTLGLFHKLQLLIPGIRSIVGDVLNNGSTVFGVVKHSATKDFFDFIDHPRDASKSIPNGSFWVVPNYERYKYISPQLNKETVHGQYTHYGIDVLVKTSKGYRFLISVAVPSHVEKDSGFAQGTDQFLQYIQDNYQHIPSFVKMLATLEKMQMFLYGGSTIPQTLTHGQASISWDVSARILAQTIATERQKQMRDNQ